MASVYPCSNLRGSWSLTIGSITISDATSNHCRDCLPSPVFLSPISWACVACVPRKSLHGGRATHGNSEHLSTNLPDLVRLCGPGHLGGKSFVCMHLSTIQLYDAIVMHYDLSGFNLLSNLKINIFRVRILHMFLELPMKLLISSRDIGLLRPSGSCQGRPGPDSQFPRPPFL